VFGSGSRTGVAILVAAKRAAATGGCTLHYVGVPDYQTAEEKLAGVAAASLGRLPWQTLTPNDSGDWLNQRSGRFSQLTQLVSKNDRSSSEGSHFHTYSNGVKTNRDAWCYGFSELRVSSAMRRTIDFFNQQAASSQGLESNLDMDPAEISWSSGLVPRALRGDRYELDGQAFRRFTYRPFCAQWGYFNEAFNDRTGRMRCFFPTLHHNNAGFYVPAPGASAPPFMALMTDSLIDLGAAGISAAQFFPRWTYEKASEGDQSSLLAAASEGDVDEWGYRRVDNITDGILAVYQEKFGPQVSKDDVFYYVYACLHSEQYRTTFVADLKRMLPRIPLAATASDFFAFVDAGRGLADLHVNYETVEPYPLHEQSVAGLGDWVAYRVEKMRWADKTTKKAIVYNSHVTLGDIPAAAHRYMLGSRSALEWLIDRYQVKTDKASGIVNDPNDWCREHDDPRYIVDLIKRVTRVSVDTMKIVDTLPELLLG